MALADAAETQLQALLSPPVEAVEVVAEEGGELPAETPADEPESEAGEQPTEEAEPVAGEPAKEASERFRFKDPMDKAIAAVAKARNIGLAEASRIVSGETSQPPAQAVAAEQQPVTSPHIDRLIASAQTLETELAELESQYEAELEGGQLLTPEIAKLGREITKKTVALDRMKADADSAVFAARTASRTSVLQRFPDAADDSTYLGALVTVVKSQWSDPEHPQHNNLRADNAPELLVLAAANKAAENIAKKQGISKDEAMRQVEASAPAKPSSATTQQPRPKVSPAPGSRTSSTSQAPANLKPTLAQLKAEAGDDPDKIDALAVLLATGGRGATARFAL